MFILPTHKSIIIIIIIIIIIMHTRFHLGINLKGLISGEEGTIPVELLTKQQRSVDGPVFLIFVVAHCDVVQMSVLEMTNRNLLGCSRVRRQILTRAAHGGKGAFWKGELQRVG